MSLVSLPEWVQIILEGGAVSVLAIAAWLFVVGKLFGEKTLAKLTEETDKRVVEVEKRVQSVEGERDRLLAQNTRLMDLMLNYKFTAQEAIDHIRPTADMKGGR